MSEWQKIETAPAHDPGEDGPEFLVWVENGRLDHGCVAFGTVYIGKKSGIRRPSAFGYSGDGFKITHWMPLPEPPKK